MKRIGLVAILGWLCAVALTTPAWAINNSNVTFSGVTTNFSGILTWPWDDTGTNNTLRIESGAVVIDTAHWFGGINNAANRNFAIVTDPGSLWSNNAGNSFIGRMGGGNQVIVTNGGAWVSANALMGSLTASASNNSVLVTGLNSLFRTTGDITMGGGGAGNTFTVTDGGTVTYGGFFTIGNVTSGNSLLITNGGRAYATGTVLVGAFDAFPSGSNNSMVVTGAGSVLTNSGNLFVGRQSAYNQMTISDQASVVNNIGFIGSLTTVANSNSVLVTGSGSTWTNHGGITLGGAGNGNRVTVTDAGLVFAGSTVTIGASSGGANNSLIVSNGGRFITSASLLMGETDATTVNNSITVTGSGSTLRAATGLLVGRYSTGNQLVISNGGVVTNGGTAYLGATAASSSNNTALVTGSGSVWSNASLIVGSASGNNLLTVTDSGRVYASDITVGNSAAAIGNQLLVTNGGSVSVTGGITLAPNGITAADGLLKIVGSGSAVTAGSLVVGAGGPGNQMIIEQGGSLSSGAGVVRIGNQAAASNSLVTVTGAGSVWSNGSSIVVGNVANNNRLVVTDGGAVYAPYFTAGESTGTGNSILVTDRGLLDTTLLSASAGNTISNIGGIYQFTTPTPGITAGRVLVTNGTVSFRGIIHAPTGPLANLSYQGDNTFRLNNASNTSVTTYTFDSIAHTSNPSNYQRLVLMNGARWQSTTLRIGSGGALEGAGVVASTVVTNAGTIAPGFASGILEFTGNLALESTSLFSMELGGTTASSYDQINVAGSLDFDGTLTVSLIDSFNPSGGDSFDLFDFGSASGTFSTVSLPTLAGDLFWDTSDLYSLGTISVSAIPEPSVILLTLAACAMFWRRRSRG
jgi:T5SS/PEP-CTERM-associated repeat protein